MLQAVAHQVNGDKAKALQTLSEALALAEPDGFIRVFTDEGVLVAQLLTEVAAYGVMPDYLVKLLAAFETEAQQS